MKKLASRGLLFITAVLVTVSMLAMHPSPAGAADNKTLVYNSSGGIVEKVLKQVFGLLRFK